MSDEETKPAPAFGKAPDRASEGDLRQQLLSQRLAASTETVAKAEAVGRRPRANVRASGRSGRQPSAPNPAQALAARLGAGGAAVPPPEVRPPSANASAPGDATPSKAPDGAIRVAWDPRKVRQFIAGVINLGELEGIDRRQQYDMATIGHQLLQQGKLTDAATVFRGLVALNPTDAYFHLAMGAVHQRQEELTEAEASYSRAIELHPRNSAALANRGEVRILSGRLVDGAKDLTDAVAADPEARLPTTKRAITTLSILRAQVKGGADA